MKDESKTKERLIAELAEMRQKIGETKASEAERKQTKAGLGESEKTARALLNASGDPALLMDTDGTIVALSRAAAKELGRDTSELVGVCIFDVLTPDVAEQWQVWREETIRAGIPVRFEERRGRKSYDQNFHPVFDDAGRLAQLAVFAHDVTDLRRAEKALRESEQRYRTLVEAMNEGLAAIDEKGMMTFANDRFCEMLGRSRDEIIGHLATEPFDENSRDVFWEQMVARRKGEHKPYEVTYIRPDGRKVHAIVSPSPILDSEGNLLGSFGVITDITERKQVEQALRASEAIARALLNAPTDMALLIEPDGTIVDLNEAAAKTLGRRSDKFIGENVYDFLDREVVEDRQALAGKVVHSGEPVRFETHARGRWFVQTNYPVLDAQGEVTRLAVIVRDITELKRTEETLREHAERLRILHEIDSAILATQSLDVMAQAAICQVRQLVHCDRASVNLLDAGAKEGTVLATDAPDHTTLGNGDRFPADPAWLEELRKGGVLAIESLLDYPVLPSGVQIRKAEGMRSVACLPLLSRGQLIGNLNLWRKSAGAFVSERLLIAREVADSLAIGIQQARLFESVNQHRERLRALAAQVTEAEETERRRLARELHDQVGQNLTALGIHLNLVRTTLSTEAPETVHSRLDESLKLVEKTMESIRWVMAELRPPILDDYGLASALRWYGEQIGSLSQVAVIVEAEDLTPRLRPPAENALFRIAQEALTNVVQHAQATRVTVTMEEVGDKVRMVVADDGIGFDPAQQNSLAGGSGWGLITMAERAGLVGGWCRTESNLDQGTRVIVELGR